jgi:hypothetical protein
MTENQSDQSGSTSSNRGSERADKRGRAHKAGAFDIRVFIGSLLGLYGVILVLTGLFNSHGRQINLLTGIGCILGSAFFVLWARLRPVVVPEDIEASGAGPEPH